MTTLANEKADLDPMIDPTPHEAYVRNLTPRVAERLINAVKTQAMKDYIGALASLKDDPHDSFALKTIAECEEFFEDNNKLKTVRRKVKFDGGLFEILCMENYPEVWGEMLPKGEDALKCPICRDGRISRSYRPKDANHGKKGAIPDPKIIFYCDVCTYRYVSHVWNMGDEAMKKAAKTAKNLAPRERDVLCRQEIHEILKEHPEYTQAEKDAVYRKMAEKWKV